MSQTFIDANYKVPEKGGYLKLQNGDTKLRILAPAVIGYEDWKDNKPVRTREEQKPLGSVDKNGKPIKPKHFWAVAVYDYTSNAIKVWQITQKSIMESILNYVRTDEYGDPQNYDLKITRTGQGIETEYQVVALPPKPLAKDIAEVASNTPVNLNALFEGGDPFEELDVEDEMFTPEDIK